ncbi:hypothetical protein JCM5350_005690 [Sporobolomyces pararoseus]
MNRLKSRKRSALDRTASEKQREEDKPSKLGKPPIFLRVRSSTWWIALCVGFGVLVDLASYSIIVPVIPFRLEALGYSDIGSKTGWLVASYAGGLIVSSPPVAFIGAKYKNRQIPLIVGLVFMIGAIIMFMEANSYALMVVARILQGFSGTVLWTIGLALVTDSVPEERAGVVLGQVMVGFSIGQGVGPPAGGSLFEKFGWRGPFVFILVIVVIDLLMRLVIVEKHQALKWVRNGVVIKGFEAPGYNEGKSENVKQQGELEEEEEEEGDVEARTLHEPNPTRNEKLETPPGSSTDQPQRRISDDPRSESPSSPPPTKSKLPSHWTGLFEMMKNPRALTSFLLTLLNGFTVGGLADSAMTIYLNDRYGLNSQGAGLVYLAIVIPVFFASPVAGWWVDRYGTKWIMFIGLILATIAYPLLIIKGPLALFVFFLVILGIGFSFFLTPITVDLNIVATESAKGITTPHVFGMFNMAFSIGSLVGPIVAGQILSNTSIPRAWTILTILSAGLSSLCLPGIFIWVGGKPRFMQKEKTTSQVEVEKERGKVVDQL